jgi:cellulose synthase/poly-beta-1,6-N-acetylglucosamine synthase-like glycosyltransferase
MEAIAGKRQIVITIRKSLFTRLRPHEINDLVLPLRIVEKGFRGVLEKRAFCREEAAEGMHAEFRRQFRITSQTLKALFQYRSLLNPFRFPLFSFELFSHKLMKYLSPLWLLLALTANLSLALRGASLYVILLLFHILFYTTAAVRWPEAKRRSVGTVIEFCRAFLWVNAAYVVGWYRYLTGRSSITWTKVRE